VTSDDAGVTGGEKNKPTSLKYDILDYKIRMIISGEITGT
jgi:hypothetical protein